MIVHGTTTPEGIVRQTELVTPEKAGSRWQGITHNTLLDTFETVAAKHEWKLENGRFALTEDGQGLAGAYDVELPNLAPPEGQRFSLGFLTSNNMKRSLRIVAGTMVFVCNNGCVTGEHILRRKHTTGIQLHDELFLSFDRYYGMASKIQDMVTGMRGFGLCYKQSDRLLMKAGRSGLVGWTTIGQIDEEYRKPSFQYEEAHKTSWGLYQAFTHVVKNYVPHRQMEMSNSFRQMLPHTEVN